MSLEESKFALSLQFLGLVFVLVTCMIDLASGKACKEVVAEELNETWYVSTSNKTGFDFVMGKKLNLEQGGGLPDPPPDDDANLKTKLCFFAAFPGVVQARYDCSYNQVNVQSCNLNTKGTALENLLKMHGVFKASKTDNLTFVIFHACLDKKEDIWTSLVPTGTKFTSDMREMILDHVETMGFDRDEEEIEQEDPDQVKFKSLKLKSCEGKVKASGSVPELPVDKVKVKGAPALPGGGKGQNIGKKPNVLADLLG